MTTLRAMVELKCALKDFRHEMIKALKIDKICEWLLSKIERVK